jgi:hypothetical protein
MSKYERLATVISEKKYIPVNLCIKSAHTFFFGAASPQHTLDMGILTAPNPAVVPVYNATDTERRFARGAHLAEEIM